jgi:hypothetical protein
MARRSHPIAVKIEPYHAAEAMSTISRARQHLANPHMVKAIKAHMDGMNAALTGGLAPKKPRTTAKKKGEPW